MKRLLLVAVMILVSLVGMVSFSRATELQNIQQSICPVIECIEFNVLQSTTNQTTEALTELLEPVNARVPASAKMYYLTVASFTGGDAITACGSGFHMSSISEIQDPGSLQFANRSIPAYDAPAYEGFGPPSDRMGWVHTHSFPIVGVSDYGDFSMSGFDQQSGTTVWFRTPIWGDSYMDRFPSDSTTGWQMAQLSLFLPEPVWCVEDPE